MIDRTRSASSHKAKSDLTGSSTRSEDSADQAPASEASRASLSYGRRGRGLGGTRVPPAIDYVGSDASLLLRPAEVAATLGISRSKVFELLAAQELPSIHIGRSTRVPREQLEIWIEVQTNWQPTASSGLLGRLRSTRQPKAGFAEAQG